jgi:hypothetical protein
LKRVAIIQSAYIPWKGFFDLIGRCDVYVIYDTAAFSKGRWHNRNRVKRPKGDSWLTIPVVTADKLGQPLEEVTVAGSWADRHWSLLHEAYQDTTFFSDESRSIRELYEALASERLLTKINERLIRWLARRLSLKTRIIRDRELTFSGGRNERLTDLCKSLNATRYLSGPSAETYLDTAMLERAGITVEWMQYGPYPVYPQPHGEFEHSVSILDTLFCTGPEAPHFIRPIAGGCRSTGVLSAPCAFGSRAGCPQILSAFDQSRGFSVYSALAEIGPRYFSAASALRPAIPEPS